MFRDGEYGGARVLDHPLLLRAGGVAAGPGLRGQAARRGRAGTGQVWPRGGMDGLVNGGYRCRYPEHAPPAPGLL